MLQDSDEMMVDDDDEDERPQMKYYNSQKVLGKLYRNIEEKEFLDEIQDTRGNNYGSKVVLQSVWAYVENETTGFQWRHLADEVTGIQAVYALFRPRYLQPSTFRAFKSLFNHYSPGVTRDLC